MLFFWLLSGHHPSSGPVRGVGWLRRAIEVFSRRGFSYLHRVCFESTAASDALVLLSTPSSWGFILRSQVLGRGLGVAVIYDCFLDFVHVFGYFEHLLPHVFHLLNTKGHIVFDPINFTFKL
jgi:hypothetical protein